MFSFSKLSLAGNAKDLIPKPSGWLAFLSRQSLSINIIGTVGGCFFFLNKNELYLLFIEWSAISAHAHLSGPLYFTCPSFILSELMPVPTIPQRLSRSGSAGSPPDMWLMWLATSYVRAVTRATPISPRIIVTLYHTSHSPWMTREDRKFFIQQKAFYSRTTWGNSRQNYTNDCC